MLRVPQIRKYKEILVFEPEYTVTYRIGDIAVILQYNTSFMSCYMVDFSGRNPEKYVVKYFMEHIIKASPVENKNDTPAEGLNADHLKHAVLTSKKAILLNGCLNKIYEIELPDFEMRNCILCNGIAAINYGLFIAVIDIARKSMKRYAILSAENVLCYNVPGSKADLASVDKVVYITSEPHGNSPDTTYRIYINGLSVVEYKTNKILRFVVSNDRIFILRGGGSVESYQIRGIVEDAFENRRMYLEMMNSNTLFNEYCSIDVDEGKGCSVNSGEGIGYHFNIKKKINTFQNIKTVENSLLIRTKTLKFLSVIPLAETYAISLSVQDSIFYYYPEKSFVSNELFTNVIDVPAFSIVQKSRDFFINIKEKTSKGDGLVKMYSFNHEIRDLEDLEYFNAALNSIGDCNGGSIWDNVFVRTILFLLFKWHVNKINSRILSSFGVKILEYFDPAKFQLSFHDENFFEKLVSHFFANRNLEFLNENTLIGLLLIDFRIVDYEFKNNRMFYDILLYAYKNIGCLNERKKYAVTGSKSTDDDIRGKLYAESVVASYNPECMYDNLTDGDQISYFQNTLLRVLLRNNEYNKIADLISDDILEDKNVVGVLLKIPLKKFRNKQRVTKVLLKYMKSHPLETESIYSILDYLKETLRCADLNVMELTNRNVFIIYKWSLSRDQSSLELMDLMFRADRKDLGCILGYIAYRKTKNGAILEGIKENIGDYVFIYKGEFIGIESLLRDIN